MSSSSALLLQRKILYYHPHALSNQSCIVTGLERSLMIGYPHIWLLHFFPPAVNADYNSHAEVQLEPY